MARKKRMATACKVEDGTGEYRSGNAPAELKQAVLHNLYYAMGRVPVLATKNDWYMAVAHTARDYMMDRWVTSIHTLRERQVKMVGYLSAEFLMGPHLGNALISLGILEEMGEAVAQLGLDLKEILGQEVEPGLGNGGLGRLAACYLDSLATLKVVALGYGIRYEFGIFDQQIKDGWQVETTDKWLHLGNPWEIPRPEISYTVQFGGRTESLHDDHGRYLVRWVSGHEVKGVAHDTPVPGYLNTMTNQLRLWKSEAVESFDFQAFNVGDYFGAVQEKVWSETISKVLYPNDEPYMGKQLRLAQQYFFVSCSLQDLIRLHLLRGLSLELLHEFVAIQLNDTHPSVAVAELMRLLVDEHRMDWDMAWRITQNTFAYTNHTLLPEALEKWPISLFGVILPRHLEIIYEINRRFLDEVRLRYPRDDGKASRLSLIDESDSKYVRMANLAALGSHAVNGVAALHSELLKETVLRDFYELYPERFLNITNGVTPRRWMVLSTPGLADLITSAIGDRWVTNLEMEIRALEPFADDAEFRRQWREVKRGNKRALAAVIRERSGVPVDPDTMFDIQVKRIHEYKRQHLNILQVVALYRRIKDNPNIDIVPRTVIFGGKAAPGYHMAKLIIKLINSVAEVVNTDTEVAGRLKVVFFPDFNVKNGQLVYPAADLSEQISTAGYEASGTGNMKFAMNGALTIGTLDGANVEIREEVGPENFFLFGLTVDEVRQRKACGYRPIEHLGADHELRAVIDLIGSGCFSKGDRDLFKPLLDGLLYYDPFMVMADFRAYLETQQEVATAYRNGEHWTRMSILNVARMGKFSSDRSIKEYCGKIWGVKPLEA